MKNKILNAVSLTATIIFTTSFLYKYQFVIQPGEILGVLICGINASLYFSRGDDVKI